MAKRGRYELDRLERDAERAPLDPGAARRVADALAAAGRSDEALAWLTWWEALLDREWRVDVRASGREPEVHEPKPASLREATAEVAAAAREFDQAQREFLDSPWELVLGLQRASDASPVVRESLPQVDFASPATTRSGFLPGDLIELVRMPDDPDPVPPGSRGRVTGVVRSVADGWQVWVRWDSGRRISLEVPPDVADVIERLPTASAGAVKGRTTLIQMRLRDGRPAGSDCDVASVFVTMFHGEPREVGGASRADLRKKYEFSGAHAAQRRASRDVIGSKGITMLGIDFTAPTEPSGRRQPASLFSFDGNGDRTFVAPGAMARLLPLASARYLLTTAWLFGKLLKPMPALMLEDSVPWRPEPAP